MSDNIPEQTSALAAQDQGDDYEEISSEEVDRVVESLDHLIEIVQSENIKHYLEEAASSIYYLVYDDETDGETPLENAA